MATTTTNYSLKKPAAEDFYNIADFNGNADIIDSTLNALSVNKVDKVTGKELSANDFTAVLKSKLDGIATGATANDTDANLKNRENHTGTQLASTISNFASAALAVVLTGLSNVTNSAITATDTILSAFGKLQAQITDRVNKDGTTAMDSLTVGSRLTSSVIGTNSVVEGNGNAATAENSHAEGDETIASGVCSHVEGRMATASGECSHVEGEISWAFGYCSHAEGASTGTGGVGAHAEGSGSRAEGRASHSEGEMTSASGDFSHAGGYNTSTGVYASQSMGTYNKALTGNATTYSGTADAFVIGNGISSVRANAFRVTFDGKTYGLSAFNSTGADYAEYFEWLDGNPDAEDRAGYFVTLDGEKIRKAIASDDYILGVVSAAPSVIGDSYNDDWSGKYLTDEWGRILYEDVLVAEKTDPLGLIIPEHTDHLPQISPAWNSTQEYTPREQRPEWTTVGMMGKLLVRDDGTCTVNGYCKPDSNGMASASTAGYRVMKRISDGTVQILLK